MRETAMSGRVGQNVELSVTSRDGFTNNSAILTPPQTPVSNPWKSASTNGVGHSLVSDSMDGCTTVFHFTNVFVDLIT